MYRAVIKNGINDLLILYCWVWRIIILIVI